MRVLQQQRVVKLSLNGGCYLCMTLALYLLTFSCTRINNYQELKNNKPICEAYMETLKEMGHHCVLNDREVKGSLDGASTDMGK